MSRELTVCYFGTYERNYPRNSIFIKGLRENGVNVIECHEPIWELTRDKSGSFLSPKSLIKLGFQLISGYLKLLKRYFAIRNDYQVMIVGYIGHLDLLLARLLTLFSGKKLIFNPLISMYDTLSADRKQFSSDSLIAKFLFALDKITCRLSDRVILDTHQHIQYFTKTFNLSEEKFEKILVGADDDNFYPISTENKSENFVVMFIGKLIPLHGIPYILEAAKLLENHKDIKFRIVGSGQLRDEIDKIHEKLELKNVEFIDWIPFDDLSEAMSQADVCLGIFGDSEKAKRVIPNKAFQALAVAKPLITGDSNASRELLTNTVDAVLCEMSNPKAIAESVLYLKNNPDKRKSIARNGYETFKQHCSVEILGRKLKELCVRVLSE